MDKARPSALGGTVIMVSRLACQAHRRTWESELAQNRALVTKPNTNHRDQV